MPLYGPANRTNTAILKYGPRLHYMMSTTANTAIFMADSLEDQPPADEEVRRQVGKAEKETIMGSANLQLSETALGDTDPVVLCHQEKPQRIYEEILHHWMATSALLLTPGTGLSLQACILLGVHATVVCKTVGHESRVRGWVLDWMVGESATNSALPWAVADSALATELGIDDPDAGSSPGESEDLAEPEDADDLEEPFAKLPDDLQEPVAPASKRKVRGKKAQAAQLDEQTPTTLFNTPAAKRRRAAGSPPPPQSAGSQPTRKLRSAAKKDPAGNVLNTILKGRVPFT